MVEKIKSEDLPLRREPSYSLWDLASEMSLESIPSVEPPIIITNPEKMTRIWRCAS